MRTEIFVEGNLLDLNKELDLQLSYLIDDVRDFSSRNSNFSKTIVLPGTAQNNFVFGNIFDVKISNIHDPEDDNIGYNYNAAKNASAIIYVDKLQVFKGVIRVLEIIIDGKLVEYECCVFGELGGLVSVLGNNELTALDFSAHNHLWDITRIKNSWSAADGSGYYYPLIDYGYPTNRQNYDMLTFRPALFAREYIDKIITGAGYTWESTFMDSAFFKQLVIPHTREAIGKTITTLLDRSNASSQTVSGLGSDVNRKLQLPSAASTDYLVVSNSNKDFTYNRPSNVSVKSTLTITINHTASRTCHVQIQKNSVVVAEITATTTGSSQTITFETVLELEPNAVYSVSAKVNLFSLSVTSCSWLLVGQPSVFLPLNIGETVLMNEQIPQSIKQKDFLLSIVRMFNLYITEDPDQDKHLVITPFVDFYNDTPSTYLDWSGKLDRSQPIKLKPLGELSYKQIELKYKDDSDYFNELYKIKYNESYGRRLYDTGLDFVKDIKTIELIFSPTVAVQFAGNDKLISCIYKSNGVVTERINSNVRILCKKVKSCNSWSVMYNGGFVTTETQYPAATHLDDPASPTKDLLFGAPREAFFTFTGTYTSNNLYNLYWSEYIAEVTDKDSKLFTAFFKLSEADIQKLDFSKFIFIDGALWRLNKITDYNAIQEGVTKCELLNVIDIV